VKKSLTLENIIAFIAATVLLVGALLWAHRTPGITQTDFSVTYVGARMIHLGLGSRLYDLAEQRKIKESVDVGGKTLIYEHPPFEAFLLSPLGGLSYRAAYLLWGVLNVLIWLSLPLFLRAHLTRPADNLSYVLLWLAFAPLWITLYVGQSSLLILLLYSFAFLSLRRGQDFVCGLVIGIALFKFQFAVPLACIFFLRGKWKIIQGFAAMALVLLAFSVTAVGWGGISSYVHLLTAVSSHPDNLSFGAAVDMATIQGFVHGAFGAILNKFVSMSCVIGISGLLILWTARSWNRREQLPDNSSNDLMFAAAVVISLITGFHMFTHDLSPMLLSMFLVAGHLSNSSKAVTRIALMTCLILFWLAPIYFLLLSWHCMFLLVPVLAVFAIGTVNLAANLRPESLVLEHAKVRPFLGVVRA
jgi:hypothetical protein